MTSFLVSLSVIGSVGGACAANYGEQWGGITLGENEGGTGGRDSEATLGDGSILGCGRDDGGRRHLFFAKVICTLRGHHVSGIGGFTGDTGGERGHAMMRLSIVTVVVSLDEHHGAIIGALVTGDEIGCGLSGWIELSSGALERIALCCIKSRD